MAAIYKYKKNKENACDGTQPKTGLGCKEPLSEHNSNASAVTGPDTISIKSDLEEKAKMQCSSLNADSNYQNDSDESLANNHGDISSLDSKNNVYKDPGHVINVEDYQSDILNYFLQNEGKHLASPNYMSRQTQINYRMRSILINWLVEISEVFNMETETLYRAVNYLDRILAKLLVVPDELLLVGLSALYIASKFEESQHKHIDEFVAIANYEYRKVQILKQEKSQLKVLEFNICVPTVHTFTNIYSVMLKMPDELKNLALYINELFLLDGGRFLQYLPSDISAASIALARYNLGQPIWSIKLEEITKCSLIDLKELVLNLYATFSNASESFDDYEAVKEKYRSYEKYKNISKLKPLPFNESVFEEVLRIYLEKKEK